MAMTLEVYPTDAEAFEAAAALAATRLAGKDHPSVALSGGRGGRAVMLALAGRDDVPWDRIDWFWVDERCVPPDDPERVPAQLVRPSDRITWFVDRAAAAELLRDARPASPA